MTPRPAYKNGPLGSVASGSAAAMPEKQNDRAEKLARRLRENLRKRKQQARGREAGPDGSDQRPPQEDDTSEDDKG